MKSKVFCFFSNSLVCLILLSLGSCVSTPKKKEPTAAARPVLDILNKVQIDMAAGSYERALTKLKGIVQKHPESDLADDAYILMGQIYMDRRDYRSAYESYISVVNSTVFSPRETDALLGAARALAKLGSYDEVLSLTNKCLAMQGLSDSARLDIYRLRFQVLSEVGDRIDALRTLIFLAENDTDLKLREVHKNRALDFVESHLSDPDLEIVAKDKSFGFVRSIAVLRMGTLLFEQRDFSRSYDFLIEAVELAPESDISEKASNLLKQIEARRKVDPFTVGTVLPLSGKASTYAYKTLRGIQLGLGIYGPNPSKIRLAVLDSEGNPDIARRSVERLVTEDHVIALIGSLLSKTSVAVASKADELGVPSIALSQKSGITEIGPTVFRNALTSEMQVRQLVNVAMNDLGISRFAIMYPNDAYGVEYANLFWDEVLARGGSISGAQTYEPNQTDFSGPVQRLVGTFYIEDRLEEYKHRLKEWHKKNGSVGGRTSPPEEVLQPLIDFEALFIPDGVRSVSQIAPMLAYQEVKGVKLLGTNLWNTPELAEKGEKFAEGSIFVDGLLAHDPHFKESHFFRDFVSTFHDEPGLFEVQGYDAGLVLRELIEDGERSRIGLTEHLAQLKAFRGVLGTLYTNKSREVERPTFPLFIDKGVINGWKNTSAIQSEKRTK
ncbi:MAG: penicillin-binding protein activator [Bdellovibrionales bacterium]|nr:penicillin-binding protein activator [Bdellovibrionales bacterium]